MPTQPSQSFGKSILNKLNDPALRITLIYIVVGSTWILISDRILGTTTNDSQVLTHFQTYKGWFYVLITAALIFHLIKTNLSRRVLAEKALQLHNDELALINQMSYEFGSTLELENVLAKILEDVRQLLGVTASSIWLKNVQTGEIVCQEVTDPQDAAVRGWQLKPDEGIVGWVIQNRRSVIVPDALVDERHSRSVDEETGIKIRSILAIPLIGRQTIFGAIEVVDTAENRFQQADLTLIELLAGSAAAAIENATLYERLFQRSVELEERVAERTHELSQANEQLKELDALKSKFVSDVSHELRTPITNLTIYLDLIDNGKPEKYERYLQILKDQAFRLRQLIESILDLSRLDDARERPIKFAAVDLKALVEEVMVAHQPRAEAADLHLMNETCANLPYVLGESGQLSQVVTNLIANALNYTETGSVHVSAFLDSENNQVCLQVKDTGRGILAKDLPYIFERFYRGQNVSQSNLPGSGLGLAIAQEIIQAHQGKIEVESVVGVGSTFQVWLPIIIK